ncbi:uncharacterized protein LOC123193122 [Mangifera indica]|uniref:uncharacterized protein LOC123193122 n=1 Tax=Mangifera indica TaxID=29780 RepID=UPI001CFC0356|nr:uncharacterized protein LOC123193122 [Mangifera indica]
MRSRYRQTKHIEGLFWRATKTYRIEDFQEALRMIRAENPTAVAYLEGIDYQRWARVYFPGIRYNIMTTNIAESFNALARQARKLLVMMLLEFLRSTLQKWFYTRRNMANACTHSLTPWAEEKMVSHIQKSANMIVKPITIDRYEVHGPSKPVAIVDLAKKECTCRKFQLSQIACTHVAAIARFQNLSHCYPWVNKYYSTKYWQAVYRENVEPLGDPSEWMQSEEIRIVHPPQMGHRRSGRTSEHNRRPSQGEETRQVECSRCHEKGHTRLVCTNPLSGVGFARGV